MKHSKIIYIIITFAIISFFYIPVIISIIKLKKELKEKETSIEETKLKKLEIKEKIKRLNKETKGIEEQKDFEVMKLKNLTKLNYLYMDSIDEIKQDSYLTERKNEEMLSIIKIYESNHIASYNTISTLKKYFQSHKLIDYLSNRTNILLTSSIIKSESDLDFLYNQVISPFFNDNSNKYILSPPCFKASIDTNEPNIFHKKCNKIENTLLVIKTNKTRLGCITEYSWYGGTKKNNNNYEETKTRLFNLDNKKIFLYNKTQSVSRHIPPIRSENYYFAIFGYNDLYIGYVPWESRSAFPQMFSKSNDTNNNFNDLMNQKIESYPKYNEINFEYQEIEVYPIILF